MNWSNPLWYPSVSTTKLLVRLSQVPWVPCTGKPSGRNVWSLATMGFSVKQHLVGNDLSPTNHMKDLWRLCNDITPGGWSSFFNFNFSRSIWHLYRYVSRHIFEVISNRKSTEVCGHLCMVGFFANDQESKPLGAQEIFHGFPLARLAWNWRDSLGCAFTCAFLRKHGQPLFSGACQVYMDVLYMVFGYVGVFWTFYCLES